jgi:hypothetical protein
MILFSSIFVSLFARGRTAWFLLGALAVSCRYPGPPPLGELLTYLCLRRVDAGFMYTIFPVISWSKSNARKS